MLLYVMYACAHNIGGGGGGGRSNEGGYGDEWQWLIVSGQKGRQE